MSKFATELAARLCNPGRVVEPYEREPLMAAHIDKSLFGVKETLSWALDILDMCDERLAQFDGKEKVYTQVHTDMKHRAREILSSITP